MKVIVPLMVLLITVGTTLFWLDYYNVLDRYPLIVYLEKGACKEAYTIEAPHVEEEMLRKLEGMYLANGLREINAERKLYKCLCQQYEARLDPYVAEEIVQYVKTNYWEYEKVDPPSPTAIHATTREICRKKEVLFEPIQP
ncbi:MAG: hypothetical protein AAFR59_00275 [Bacteroidota bacterium]